MTPSDALIRPMNEADLPAVLGLEERCFPDPWSEGVFRSALREERALWLCAELKGEIAGYGGMEWVLDEGYVDNLAVSPDFRRQGLGAMLLKAMIGEAQRRRLRFLSLEVRAGNEGAIALYRSLNFDTEGLRPGYYLRPREDALIMTRDFEDESYDHSCH